MGFYRMFDLAFYDSSIVGIAQSNGVRAIGGYIFDPFIGGGQQPAGWSNDAIQAIENAGIAFIPIFTQDAVTGEVAGPDQCAAMLNSVPRNNNLVALDVEGGSDMGQGWNAAWFSQMKAAGYRTIEYGLPATLNRDSGEADYKWVAGYVRNGWDDSCDPHPGADAWQYAGSANIDGITVDLTNSYIPLADQPVVVSPEVLMGFYQSKECKPGANVKFGGIWTGAFAIPGYNRIWYVDVNCDTADGPGPCDYEMYLNAPDQSSVNNWGSTEGFPGLNRIPPAMADLASPTIVIDGPVGKECYLIVYNKGKQPVEVTVHTDV